jgi:hypothetical protein
MPNTSATGGVLAPSQPYPIDDDALDDVLTTLIVAVTGLDPTLVRPRWQPIPQKQPEADINWCAVGVINDAPNDGPSFGFDGANNRLNLSRHEDITALATFYGPLAKTTAAILRDGLSLPQNLESLAAYSLALIDTGPILAVNELMNQTWVKRRDMALHLRRQVVRAYPVNSILKVPVALTDDTTVDDTFTVPPGTP